MKKYKNFIIIMFLMIIILYSLQQFLPRIWKSDVITVNSYNDLENAVRFGKGGVVMLTSDIKMGKSSSPIVVDKELTIDLNGFKITKDNDKELFVIGCEIDGENGSIITEKISVEPLSFPDSFLTKIEDTSCFEIGDLIEIRDEYSAEYNIIKDIKDINTIVLGKRPENSYRTGGSIIKISNRVQNICLKNGTICNAYEEFDGKMMTEQTGFVGKKGIIYIYNAKNIKIQDISIQNNNCNQNNIQVENCEEVSVSDCFVKGGRNGVSFNSNHCKIVNSVLEDCSSGVWLSGDFNQISTNQIISSGKSLNHGDAITIAGNASDNIIDANTIVGGNCYGIWGLNGKKERNIITNNSIKSNVTYAIMLQEGSGFCISNNIIDWCSGGIVIDDVTNSNIESNIVSNNLVSGIAIGKKCCNIVVANNNLFGNNFVDRSVAGYGGDIVIWGKPINIIVENNCTDEEIIYLE